MGLKSRTTNLDEKRSVALLLEAKHRTGHVRRTHAQKMSARIESNIFARIEAVQWVHRRTRGARAHQVLDCLVRRSNIISAHLTSELGEAYAPNAITDRRSIREARIRRGRSAGLKTAPMEVNGEPVQRNPAHRVTQSATPSAEHSERTRTRTHRIHVSGNRPPITGALGPVRFANFAAQLMHKP